ncbi:hypothetical protein MSAN_00980600 [Mycena sanguinolenta]|uniref:Uncharacterized protein n=1 Tax=Mycena sanguinolenta TaxID=230812 RepID=A0A8H6YU51_9AGAR|nr:hypothetical protein MSAN_00980600 [Mycena sanguinolenta]
MQTSSEVAAVGAAFDNIEDTNQRAFRSVSPSWLTFPTPVTDFEPPHAFGTVDGSWWGNVEHSAMSCSSGTATFNANQRHEMSACSLDVWAALRHEVARVVHCAVDASAATIERQESPPTTYRVVGGSAAKRHEVSRAVHCAVETPAALRHEVSPRRT